MKAIDFLILILLMPLTTAIAAVYYLNFYQICTNQTFLCLGFGWLADLILIPFVVASTAAGFFLLCKRLKTHEI